MPLSNVATKWMNRLYSRYNINWGFFILTVFLSSIANSQDWTKVEEIDSTDIFAVIVHEGSIYTTTGTTIFESTNGGATWQPTAGQPDAAEDLSALFSYRGFLYLGTLNHGVFRSSNGGESWEAFNSGLGATAYIVGFTALGDTLYVGTGENGIYVVNPQLSNSWTAFNAGLFQFGVNSIATSGDNIVASIGLYLFIRSRTASQWTDIYVDSVGVQRTIYETVSIGQYLFAGTDRGVYRGTLDGQNWQKVDISAFPDQDIVALTVHGSRIMAGLSYLGQHWLFTSDNLGETWDVHAHEFAQVWDLHVAFGRVWAARSDGLWYSDLDVQTNVIASGPGDAHEFGLYQNYPNPFNPVTRITYQIQYPGHVNLTVYDLNGRDIETLVNKHQDIGRFEVAFAGGELASGVYIYRLKTDQVVISKKMILTK